MLLEALRGPQGLKWPWTRQGKAGESSGSWWWRSGAAPHRQGEPSQHFAYFLHVLISRGPLSSKNLVAMVTRNLQLCGENQGGSPGPGALFKLTKF